ncbi:MAG TPA: hypothetical protein VML54_05800 [Candidatus Limnocylindrales bacterium]|nr:hypothetical protein [Candidatus Limnocylindrales bacterium]
MANTIELTIQARDESAAVIRKSAEALRQHGETIDTYLQRLKQLQYPGAQAAAGFDGLAAAGGRADASMRRVGAGIRTLALPAALQLGDALGSTVSRMAGVVAGGAAIGGAMGLAAAGVGVLTLAVGGLVESWGKAAAREKEFQRVLTTGDIPAITAQVKDLTTEIINLTEARDKARADVGLTLAARATRGVPGAFVPGASQQRGIDTKSAAAEEGRRAAAAASAEQFIVTEEPKQIAALLEKIAADERAGIAAAAQLRAENVIRRLEGERAIAQAGLQSLRQVLEAEGARTLSIEARSQLAVRFIGAQRDLELKAIAEVAAAKRAAIEGSGAPPQVRAEQTLQVDRDATAQRRQLDAKLILDGIANHQKFTDERIALEERWYAAQGALGKRSLQDELARHEAILKATEEGSRRQVEAMERVAALRAQIKAMDEAAGPAKPTGPPPPVDPLTRSILLQMGLEQTRAGKPPDAFHHLIGREIPDLAPPARGGGGFNLSSINPHPGSRPDGTFDLGAINPPRSPFEVPRPPDSITRSVGLGGEPVFGINAPDLGAPFKLAETSTAGIVGNLTEANTAARELLGTMAELAGTIKDVGAVAPGIARGVYDALGDLLMFKDAQNGGNAGRR